jgi:hypothetical protein
MTVKRNFKRRVRQRQVRTGESYVTARRHMLASRPDADGGRPAGGDGEAPQGEVGEGVGGGAEQTRSSPIEPEPSLSVSVIELVDVFDHARRADLECPIAMFPDLAGRVLPARVLDRLRTVLLAINGDPAAEPLVRLALAGRPPAPRKSMPMTAELRVRLALAGRPPAPRESVQMTAKLLHRFLQRAHAGIGAMSDDGGTLAFHVADGDTMVPVLCVISARETRLVLSTVDELLRGFGAAAEPPAAGRGEPGRRG